MPRHKVTAKFVFTEADRKRRKNIFYQLYRFVILGLHFWKLSRLSH